MRILAVDDETDILELLAAALRSVGITDVSTARSAKEALSVCETARSPFDVFLIDIQMPETTGIELCAELRRHPQYRNTPIIILTAMSDSEHIDKAFSAGATDYLMKPFSLVDLKYRITLAEEAAWKEQQIARLAQAPTTLNPDQLRASNSFRLSDALPIDDVAYVVRLHAFDSYLRQQSLAEFQLKKLVIVKVTNVQQIFDRCDPDEFLDQMSDVAEAISNALVGVNSLISYCGSGIFVMTVDTRDFAGLDQFMMSIKDCVAMLAPCYRNGDRVKLTFGATEIKKPTFFFRESRGKYVTRLMEKLGNAPQMRSGLSMSPQILG